MGHLLVMESDPVFRYSQIGKRDHGRSIPWETCFFIRIERKKGGAIEEAGLEIWRVCNPLFYFIFSPIPI